VCGSLVLVVVSVYFRGIILYCVNRGKIGRYSAVTLTVDGTIKTHNR